MMISGAGLDLKKMLKGIISLGSLNGEGAGSISHFLSYQLHSVFALQAIDMSIHVLFWDSRIHIKPPEAILRSHNQPKNVNFKRHAIRIFMGDCGHGHYIIYDKTINYKLSRLRPH